MKLIYFSEGFINVDKLSKFSTFDLDTYIIYLHTKSGDTYQEIFDTKEERDERYFALLKELNISPVCNEVWNA